MTNDFFLFMYLFVFPHAQTDGLVEYFNKTN